MTLSPLCSHAIGLDDRLSVGDPGVPADALKGVPPRICAPCEDERLAGFQLDWLIAKDITRRRPLPSPSPGGRLYRPPPPHHHCGYCLSRNHGGRRQGRCLSPPVLNLLRASSSTLAIAGTEAFSRPFFGRPERPSGLAPEAAARLLTNPGALRRASRGQTTLGVQDIRAECSPNRCLRMAPSGSWQRCRSCCTRGSKHLCSCHGFRVVRPAVHQEKT